MSKEKIPEYQGWYTPHAPVDWAGEILDPKTGELVKEESLTKQSFKDECDVNNIVALYARTQDASLLNARLAAGQFADLPAGFEYQDALNLVVEGRQAFEALPSKIRERFNNDPAKFLEFMADAENQDEAIKLGLATRRPEPAPEQPQAPSPPSAPPLVPEGS